MRTRPSKDGFYNKAIEVAIYMKTQKQWREEKRQSRRNLSVTEKHHKSQQIIKKIIQSDYYKNSQNIGVYFATPEEVNLQTLIETAWQDGKMIYLPVINQEKLLFSQYAASTTLIKDTFNISVPKCDNYVLAKELDLVITPLVAFDDNNNRIGMGGGFYDRAFSFKKIQQKPILVGVAFALQKTNTLITTNRWDICLDKVITE